jgi:DNA-binding NtrC family response regulator
MQRRILVVDDEPNTRQQLQKLLATDGRIVESAVDGHEALTLLKKHAYSVVVTDLQMSGMGGQRLIEEMQKARIASTVVVLSGHATVGNAVAAMRVGAYDFLTKPVDADHLHLVVERALAERALRDEVILLREQLQNRYSYHTLLSKNPQMHAMFQLIQSVAETDSTLLIEGETGTGKEQVARAVHQSSQLRQGPLVAVNCAALPETLLESELFGHEKGAFTGAMGRRQGRFEMADGGTLFLDEVGDIPAAMQAKLLRVLQERRFERVGGTESIEVDVRVISATNRSLLRLVKAGKFREDLYYRLNVVKIDLPPLRERPEDIPLLAVHFAEKYARPSKPAKQIAPETMRVLLSYAWPGNVRELENTIERACVTCLDDIIPPGNLAPEILSPAPSKAPFRVDLERPLPSLLRDLTATVERVYIRKALKRSRGNIGRCAKICGLSRRSITAKVAEYGIDKAPFKEV